MTMFRNFHWTAIALTVGIGLSSTAAHAEDAPAPSRGAFVVAGKVGGLVPFSKLSAHVIGSLELGYAFGPGRSLVGYLDVSYAVPQADGEATDPRVPSQKWSYELWQKQLVLQPSFAYRFTKLVPRLTPYVGIGPRIYFLETVTEGKAGGQAFGTSYERSTRLGVGVPLGVEWALGPGGLTAEILLQWAPLDHRITGDTNLGSGTLFLGYRALL